MSVEITLLVIVVGAVSAVLLARAWSRKRAAAAAQATEVAELGFVPCPEDAEYLQSIVRRLRGDSSAEVHHAYRRGTGKDAVYWYHAHVHKHDAPIQAEEFLFGCEPLATQRFALFLQPASLPEGRVKHLLASLLAKVSSLAPSGIAPIEIPVQLRARLLAVLGPSGQSLNDLIDDRNLTLLLSSAARGFFAIRVAEGHCAMELMSIWGRNALPDFDWKRAASAAVETAARVT